MKVLLSVCWACWLFGASMAVAAEDKPKEPADLIIHHAKVVTVDARFSVVEAVAVKAGRIVGLGDDETIFKWQGPKTKVIDAESRTVLTDPPASRVTITLEPDGRRPAPGRRKRPAPAPRRSALRTISVP